MGYTTNAPTRSIWRACLLSLTFFALIACEPAKSLKPLAPDAVILAFGDSLTYGTGASDGASYPDVLAELLDRTVVNAGVPGEVTSRGRERLPSLLQRHRPALVVLMHGGNDFLRRTDPREVRSNLRAMVTMIQEAGAETVLIGVPRPGLFLSVPDLYQDLADEHQLAYDGEVLPELIKDRARKSDLVHLNADGYRKLAEAVHRLTTNVR